MHSLSNDAKTENIGSWTHIASEIKWDNIPMYNGLLNAASA